MSMMQKKHGHGKHEEDSSESCEPFLPDPVVFLMLVQTPPSSGHAPRFRSPGRVSSLPDLLLTRSCCSDEAIPPSPFSANYVGGSRAMADSFFEPFLQPELLGRGRTESVTSEIRSCPCPAPSSSQRSIRLRSGRMHTAIAPSHSSEASTVRAAAALAGRLTLLPLQQSFSTITMSEVLRDLETSSKGRMSDKHAAKLFER